jgi:metallo-beta-lactamase family protein
VQGRAGSKALDAQTGPGIIISASGMATGGRVLHHLAKYLPDPASCVVFVGFQASGTRGARLQHGEREIKIHGEMIPVNAQIESMGSLSAHADSLELMRWMSAFKRPPKTTFLVHGEPTAASALAEKVTQQLGWHVVIPEYKRWSSHSEIGNMYFKQFYLAVWHASYLTGSEGEAAMAVDPQRD